MTSDWYFAKAGAPAGSETGPFTWEQLYQLAKNGTVEPNDLVWNPKLPSGVMASLVPGLFQELDTPEAPVQQVWVEQSPVPITPEPPAPETPTPTSPPSQPTGTPAPTRAALGEIEDIPSTQALAEESAPELTKRRATSKPDGQSNRLPLLVVLLTFIIAACGVAAYFLYFRV